jgi:hypothetical protein
MCENIDSFLRKWLTNDAPKTVEGPKILMIKST